MKLVYSDHCPFPVIHFDRALNVRYANESAITYFDAKSDAFFQQAKHLWKEKIMVCLEKQVEQHMDTEVAGKTFSVVFIPVRGGDEAVVYCVDISPQRWAEEQLAENMKKFEEITENIPSHFFILDAHGRFVYCDPEFSEFSSLATEEIPGHHFTVCKLDENLESAVCELLELENNDQTNSREFSCEYENGCFHYRLTVFPQFQEGANNKIDIFKIRDITGWKEYENSLVKDISHLKKKLEKREKQLKKARRKLIQKERLADIGTLSATVAHELRNPLATIKASIYNIRRKNAQQNIISHVDVIEKKISESDQIINNLLFYARIKMSRMCRFQIYDLMNESLDTSCSKYNDISDDQVKREFEDLGNRTIFADPLQISELLINLIDNALGVIDSKDGNIKVSARENDSVLLVKVVDDGCGIPSEYLESVCKPFFTTKSSGTGLGLSVCQQIVDLHDGSLELQSEEGSGTEVVVRLPLDLERKRMETNEN